MRNLTDRAHAHQLSILSPSVLLLVGGSLNGFAVRMIESWTQNGFSSVFLGLSPFELITLFVAATLVANAPLEKCPTLRTYAPEFAAAMAMLIPSSAVTWGALALYATYKAINSNGSARTGALLFAALAASALWSSLIIKLVAIPVTTIDATIVGFILSMLKSGVVQSANVVGVPDGHTLIVMTACASLDAIPAVLVGLAAIFVFSKSFDPITFAKSAGLFAALYVTANLIRLTMMAWSFDLYTIAHGPIGSNVFDIVVTIGAFAIALREDSK